VVEPIVSTWHAVVVGAPADDDTDRTIRISMSVLLRIRDDDRLVLFHLASRPGAFGPPGGVLKYFPPATVVLDELGFRPERSNRQPNPTREDLRGFLPASELRRFLRWHDSGAYRETAVECLTRELVEELAEVGLPHLCHGTHVAPFVHLRTVGEGPQEVSGQTYRQYRRFEVYDLVAPDSDMLWLRQELVAAGSDPAVPLVICVDREGVLHGRHETALIAPHTAFLLGHERVRQDIPPVR
jgi:SMODS-associated NUDIX domain